MDFESLAFGAIVLAVVAAMLRVFWTLWSPLDRKLNPGKTPGAVREASLPELNGVPLHVHLNSGRVLENVTLGGTCALDAEDVYEVNQMLVLHAADGREYFVRAAQVEYFETAPMAPPSPPEPDEPETWR